MQLLILLGLIVFIWSIAYTYYSELYEKQLDEAYKKFFEFESYVTVKAKGDLDYWEQHRELSNEVYRTLRR